MTNQHDNRTDRRDFLKTGAVAAGAALATGLLPSGGAFAAGSDEVRVGIIGCGGRGTGAAHDVLRSAKGVKIVALADAFEFRVNGCQRAIEGYVKGDKDVTRHGNQADVEGRCFHGLDAWKKVIDSDINYLILATPPGFRPQLLHAAVNAGKKMNIFTEKPVASDGTGIRKVLEAYETAKKKGIAIAAGTQRRHQTGYLETMKRVHDGGIGDITAMRCYWMQNHIWFRPRAELSRHKAPTTDLAFQLHNWYHFVWTCGDHIVEQHVHNLDVCNWALGAHPTRAVGMGARSDLPRGKPIDVGQIYDHFAIDFEYPKGVHMLSMCRQIDNCQGGVSEALVGTRGKCDVNAYRINGKPVFNRRKDNLPYIQEHTDLIASIRKGEPINELKNVAESTLTAIMGRMSAYTGKAVTWEQALNTRENLVPETLSWEMKVDLAPPAVPGQTPLI
jgi:predicted dehydrogenase